MRKRLFTMYFAVSIAAASLWLVSPSVLTNNLSFAANAAVPAPQPGQKKVVLKNLGMSCPFCKAAVSAKLKQVPGVIAYDVDVKSDSATVLYEPAKVTIEQLKKAIAEAGFQVRAVEEVDR
jgi:copper chaperone